MIPAPVPENCTTGIIRISSENLTQTRKIVSKNGSPEKSFGKIIHSGSKENRIGSSLTLPRSVPSDRPTGNPDSGSATPDFGSLKRRKTFRSASLGSLLQNREDEAQLDNPVNPTRTLNPVNPLILSRPEASSPITFTSSVKVQYKTILPVNDDVIVKVSLISLSFAKSLGVRSWILIAQQALSDTS